jgi:hypothetical protein
MVCIEFQPKPSPQVVLWRYKLLDNFAPSMEKLNRMIWRFDRLVEAMLPQLYELLQRHSLSAEYYAISWLLTLFAADLPLGTVHRIWDLFFVHGERIINQVGLALL